jgi:hypothetical protein
MPPVMLWALLVNLAAFTILHAYFVAQRADLLRRAEERLA